jgi:hypothetical protein
MKKQINELNLRTFTLKQMFKLSHIGKIWVSNEIYISCNFLALVKAGK